MIVQIQVTGVEELAAAFVAASEFVSDLTPVFEKVGDEVLASSRTRFDASGPGWAPLTASTVKRKGHARILRDTDALYGSFSKGALDNVFRVTPLTAEFGTSDMKAQFHQFGTARMPKRTVIEITDAQEARFTQIVVEAAANKFTETGFAVNR